MTDDYLLAKVTVNREQTDAVETAMLDCGALSCTYQDATDTPIHEPAPGETPLWPDVIVTGVFAQGSDADLTCHLLSAKISADITTEALPDTDWERVWMEDFKPVEISGSLWIVPTFCEPPDASATNISIDPGLAFGSGTHPTTHLCLQWLAKEDLKSKVVIDYGCGSGILAIAAALMGAAKVYAFDIDPQALIATQVNAQNNSVAEQIIICHNDTDIPAHVDVLVANILLSPLLELQSRFSDLLCRKGRLGVSGVLAEQLDTLASAYASRFCHAETEIRDQWAMYTAIKQGNKSS